MGQAIDYEIDRQTRLLSAGEKIPQETRGWDSVNGKTFIQRVKENAADYRYFPDPDLPAIDHTPEQIEKLKASLPLTNEARAAAWQAKYNIADKYAHHFLEKATTIAWAEKLWAAAAEAQVDVAKLANFLVNGKLAYSLDDDPKTIVAKFQATTSVDQSSDDELLSVIDQVITAHPDEVARFRAGEAKLLGFFMGQIMRAAGKKLDAQHVNALLRQRLSA